MAVVCRWIPTVGIKVWTGGKSQANPTRYYGTMEMDTLPTSLRNPEYGNDPGLGLSCTWLDFDLDGDLDLHVANDLQSKDRLYQNNGDGTFQEALASCLPYSTWFSMGSDFGDINNDGRFDHLVVDMASTSHYRAKVQMGDMSRFRYFMESESPPQLMRNCLFLNTGTPRYLEVAPMARTRCDRLDLGGPT